MIDVTLAQAIFVTGILAPSAFFAVRFTQIVSDLVKHIFDRLYPKEPDVIAAEAMSQAVLKPLDVEPLLDAQTEAITKVNELVEANRKSIDTNGEDISNVVEHVTIVGNQVKQLGAHLERHAKLKV